MGCLDLRGWKIILGSASPRRKELMSALDIDFTVDTRNNFEEDFRELHRTYEIPAIMSEGKSEGFHRQLSDDEILVTADTIVLCGDDVLGKPADREEAVAMLKELSGKEHEVVTAVTIRSSLRKVTFSDTAKVRFADLDDEEITYYVDQYRPFDKAGAYGVQEWIGYIGIESIDGSFYTIMGFPVFLFYRKLKNFIAGSK